VECPVETTVGVVFAPVISEGEFSHWLYQKVRSQLLRLSESNIALYRNDDIPNDRNRASGWWPASRGDGKSPTAKLTDCHRDGG
jgi:hypothetical protein